MKSVFKIILGVCLVAQMSWAQSIQENAEITALPPESKIEPKTPISMLLSTFEDPGFQGAIIREQNRFKLLNMGLTAGTSLAHQTKEYELISEFSKSLSGIFVDALRQNVKQRLQVAVEESPFKKLYTLAKQAKEISKKIRVKSSRKIAMSFKPSTSEPKFQIENLLLDKINVSYNTFDQTPKVFAEHKLAPTLKTQVYYDVLLKTLDSAFKKQLTKEINFHVINRNNFAQQGDKSVIFGFSIQLK
jgi:hypothetical protein